MVESALSSKSRWSGRLRAALLLLVSVAAAAGFLTVHSAQANPNQVIGLDMTPTSGSTPAGTGGVDTCVKVNVGDSFQADVFATNLQNLTHYEFRIDFDPSILSFDKNAVAYNFLLTKDGGGALFPLTDEDRPGRWFIAAAESAHPDSGSGTLARLTFKALKKGTSTISIAANPVGLRPILGGNTVSIGDDNGDGYWDGGLSSGKVAVGSSCSGSTPIVTPAPTDVPNITPKPGAGSATPTPGGGGSEPTDSPGGGNDTPDAGPGSGDGSGGTSPPFVEDIGAGDGNSTATGAPGNIQGSEDGSGDGRGGVSQAGSEGSSSSTMIILAVVAAALAAAAGVMLLWLRTASGRE